MNRGARQPGTVLGENVAVCREDVCHLVLHSQSHNGITAPSLIA